jgi:membrane-associated protein
MSLISFLIDFVLHMDRYLGQIVTDTGLWTYVILFVVIFIETGLVVTPFLPGDSILFAAGALIAAQGVLDIKWLYLLMVLAAVSGDTANYWIGHYFGPRVFNEKTRWLKKEYLDRTHTFYEKHGGKTIFFARFIPIIRTFAPFVAGIGQMTYGHFLSFNVAGGILWPALFLFGGYYFGNIAFIKNHFSLVVIAIVLISLLPALIEVLRNRKSPEKTEVKAESENEQL